MATQVDLHQLIVDFATRLESAIRASVVAEVAAAIEGVDSPPVLTAGGAMMPAARTDASGKRPCPVAGCRNPAAGPKYGWRCREHGAAYRAAKVAGLPGDAARVTLGATRAPPAAKDPSMPRRAARLCPVPGCGKPAAGPKYQWRCRDHGALKTPKSSAR